MSESRSRILYPFEIARRPTIEPEVRRAILARWSSNRRTGQPCDEIGAQGRSERWKRDGRCSQS